MAGYIELTTGGCTVTVGTDRGYVKSGGATMTPTVELYTANVEQLDTPDRAWCVNRGYELTFTLVEMTQTNIPIGLGTDNSFAANSIDIGDNQFEPSYKAISITGKTAGATQYARTLTAYRAVISTPAPIKFSKEEETNLAMTFMLLQDTVTQNCVFDIVDSVA